MEDLSATSTAVSTSVIVAVLLIGIIVGVTSITALPLPLYIFRGSVDGEVSFLGYSLRAFGKPVDSLLFDSLPLYSLPVILYSLIDFAAPVVVFLLRNRVCRALELVYGNTLGEIIVVYGFLRGLHVFLEKEKSTLLANVAIETAIGRVVFRPTRAFPGLGYEILYHVLPLLVAAHATASLVAYYMCIKREDQGERPQ